MIRDGHRAESLEFAWKMPEGTEALYNEGFVQPVIDTLQSQATKVCLVIVWLCDWWLSVPLIIVLSFSHNPCMAWNQTLPHAILVLGKCLEGFYSSEVKTYGWKGLCQLNVIEFSYSGGRDVAKSWLAAISKSPGSNTCFWWNASDFAPEMKLILILIFYS